MEINYNERLEQVLKTYNCVATGLVDSAKIHDFVISLFQTRVTNKKIAIWGVGRNNTINSHAAILIKKYILEINGLSYLIDGCVELQGDTFMGYPIIAPHEIEEKGIDLVIIGSRASRKSIVENLKEVAPYCEYIDIYEELKQNGMEISYNFYQDGNLYTELYQTRIYYETSSEEKKAYYLKKLIALYLKIRDFYYAEYYLKEYERQHFLDFEKLHAMWGEIKSLLSEVKARNQRRKGDVSVFFIDSLRAMDVYQKETDTLTFSILGEYLKEGAVFEHAYSTGATTYESMLSIVKQKLPYEENVYADGFMFDFEEFPLLPEVKKSGRAITFYTAQDYYILNPSKEHKRKEYLYMPEKLWQAACDMAESNQPTFNFVYCTWELHFPLVCGYHRKKPEIRGFFDVGVEDMSSFIVEQLEDCLHYVDLQFSYYKAFFSPDMMSIFFGDHSQVIYEEKQLPYFAYCKDVERSIHVAFAICHKDIKPEVIAKPISMIDFNPIVLHAIQNKEIKLPERNVLRYQYYNVHNKKLHQIGIEKALEDYLAGVQGFLCEEGLILLTATGKEEVILKEDANEAAKERLLEKIKQNYNCSFPSFLEAHFE